MIDKEANIIVNDWYYTSLEHDLPFVRKCKEIVEGEYWLDGDLKYLMSYNKEFSDANYGSVKIIASTDKSLNLPLLPPIEEDIETISNNHLPPEGTLYRKWVKMGFIAGYKAATSKKYTEEDMNQALFIGARNPKDPKKAAIELEEYKKSLNPLPTHVEVSVKIGAINRYVTPDEIKESLLSKLQDKGETIETFDKLEVDENNIVNVIRWIYEST